jgi:hypothetical protein
MIPIIAPKIIRNPIDPIVFPNPCFIDVTIVSAGRVTNARNTETTNSETNAFNFRVEVRRIMAIILTRTRIEITAILIFRFMITAKTKF